MHETFQYIIHIHIYTLVYFIAISESVEKETTYDNISIQPTVNYKNHILLSNISILEENYCTCDDIGTSPTL